MKVGQQVDYEQLWSQEAQHLKPSSLAGVYLLRDTELWRWRGKQWWRVGQRGVPCTVQRRYCFGHE